MQLQQSNKNLRILKAGVNMNNTPKPHRFWPGFLYLVLTAVFYECYFYFMTITRKHFTPETLKYWVGVQRGQSYLMERKCLFSLVSHPSSDGTLGGRCFITSISLAYHLFLLRLVKTKSDFIVRSVETGLGRWTLVVAVISVDAYPFLAFLDLTCHLEDTGIGVFWLHCTDW